ncbi:hypothetical protein Tco_1073016, partial [Tanacetum coccineum]
LPMQDLMMSVVIPSVNTAIASSFVSSNQQFPTVLQERGFRCLPSSTEANPRDQVKSISTTIEADSYPIRHIDPSNTHRLNGYYRVEKKGSYGPQFSEAYSEASHINNFIPRKEKDPALSSGYIADFDPEEDENDPEEDPADHPVDGGDNDDNESSDDDEDDDDVETGMDGEGRTRRRRSTTAPSSGRPF